jgi:hypothetical protein
MVCVSSSVPSNDLCLTINNAILLEAEMLIPSRDQLRFMVPQETIRMISGHSTSQALNAYLHTLPAHLHEATDTLSEYVPPNKMLNVSINEQGTGLIMNG